MVFSFWKSEKDIVAILNLGDFMNSEWKYSRGLKRSKSFFASGFIYGLISVNYVVNRKTAIVHC